MKTLMIGVKGNRLSRGENEEERPSGRGIVEGTWGEGETRQKGRLSR